MPLWMLCAIVFVAILGVALTVMLWPELRARDRRRAERVAELRRYRVLGAQDDDGIDVVPARRGRHQMTAAATRVTGRVIDLRGNRKKLVTLMERSGLRMRPEEWLAIEVATVVGLAAVGLVVAGPAGVAFGALGWLGCRVYVMRRVSSRAAKFEEQLPDVLQLVAGALRTGFALNQSIAAVARECAEPASGELARVLQEVRLGAELEDALDDLADRMDSQDLRLVVISIRTAREVGGNLAEILATTVETMRERVQLRGQVKVLSAEGRVSARVLTGLPILLAGILMVMRKGYLTPLVTTAMGLTMTVTGVVLLVIGGLWLRKLTKIEV